MMPMGPQAYRMKKGEGHFHTKEGIEDVFVYLRQGNGRDTS